MRILFFISVMLFIAPISASAEICDSECNIGAGYIDSRWEAASIKGVDYRTTGLRIFHFDFNSPYFDYRYEATPGDKAEQQKLIEAEKPPAWLKHLMELNLGPLKLDYEKVVFLTDLTLLEDKVYVSFDDGFGQIFSEGHIVSSMTEFEDISILFQNDEKSMWIGYYSVNYQKPYSITIGSRQLSNFIFDSKFTGWGIRMGLEATVPQNGFYPLLRAEMIIGEGDIEFVDGIFLSDQLSSSMDIEYFEIDADLGFGYLMDEDLALEWKYSHRNIEYSLDDATTMNNEDIYVNDDVLRRIEMSMRIVF